MDQRTEEEGLSHLKQIEEELGEIRDRAPTGARYFLFGLLQGAGAIVGSLVALALIGWLLSVFGVIPGLSVLAHYLGQYVSSVKAK